MRRRRSHRIEVVQIHQAGGGFVVIAAHEKSSQLARPVTTSLGLAP